MSRTERSREGYLLVDARGAPDVPGFGDLPTVPEGSVLECPTFTCSHCNGIVVVNPDRTRARARCHRCHHLICDACGGVLQATDECLPWSKRMDAIQERVARRAAITEI